MSEREIRRRGQGRHRMKSDAQKQRDRERSHFERILTTRIFQYGGLFLLVAAVVYLALLSSGAMRWVWIGVAVVAALVPVIILFVRSGLWRSRDFWLMVFWPLIALVIAFVSGMLMNEGALPAFSRIREMGVVFFAVWSMGCMIQARLTVFQPALMFSLIWLLIAFLIYSSLYIFKYFGAIFLTNTSLPLGIFLEGLVSGLFLLTAVWFDRRILKYMKVTLSKEWFNRSRYRELLQILFYLTLFLWGFWIWNLVAVKLFPSALVSVFALSVYTFSFLIFLIRRLRTQRTGLREGLTLIAPVLALIYLFVLTGTLEYLLSDYLHSARTIADLSGVTLNMLAMVLAVILLFTVYGEILKLYARQRPLIHLFQVYIVLYLLFLLLILYHQITILFLTGTTHISTTVAAQTGENIRLPFSLVAGGWALLVLIWSVIRGHRFLRLASILLLVAVIIKILGLDLTQGSPQLRIAILVVVGLLLVFFSLVYPRFRKALRPQRSSRHRRS